MKYIKLYENKLTDSQKITKIIDGIYTLFFKELEDADEGGEEVQIIVNDDSYGEYIIVVLFEIVTKDTLKCINKFNDYLGVDLYLELEINTDLQHKPSLIGTRMVFPTSDIDGILSDFEALNQIDKYNL